MSGMPHAPLLPSFNPDEDPTSNGQWWDKYLKPFDNYFVAANMISDARQKALLLWLAGERVHDIYDRLSELADYYTAARTKITD